MKNDTLSELEIFDRVNYFNKKIYIIEAQMRTLFFENVNIDSNYEIVPPIISKKGSSDFEKINYEIKIIKLQIKDINKKILNLQSFTNLIIKKSESIKLSKEEYEIFKKDQLEKIKSDLEEQRSVCEQKIETIETAPLAYLRFLEFQCSDFSKVKDKNVRKSLEEKNRILKKYVSERNELLQRIKKNEKKENGLKLSLKTKSNTVKKSKNI